MDSLLNKGLMMPSAADMQMLYNLNELYQNYNPQNELNTNDLLLASNYAAMKAYMGIDASTPANLSSRNQASPFIYKMDENDYNWSTCADASHSGEFERSLSFMDNTLNMLDKSQKYIRDPISHKLVEKRRRDRMNKQLSRLRDTLPTHMAKKGSVRVEKAEIVEMAIEYINILKQQVHNCASQVEICNSSPKMCSRNEEEPMGQAENTQIGEVEAKESTSELAKILKEPGVNKAQFLRDDCLSQKEPVNENPCFKKFKKELSSRFNVNSETNYSEASDSASVNKVPREPTLSIINGYQMNNQQENVLVFAAHPLRTHYVPILVERNILNQLSPYYSQLPNQNSKDVCHPISIQVDFVGNLTLPLIGFRN